MSDKSDKTGVALKDDPLAVPHGMVDEGEYDEPTGIQWDESLLQLPSSNCMLRSDIGLPEGDLRHLITLARSAGKGPEVHKAREQLETAKQVFFELMRRAVEQRPLYGSKGEALYHDSDGSTTTKAMESIEGNRYKRRRRAREWRSRYGVRSGREVFVGKGVPTIEPGHWKRVVSDNWYDILPRLKFKELKPSFQDAGAVAGAREHMIEQHAAIVLNDSSGPRQALLRWLRPFLTQDKVVSDWNGED
jgi:hypothetical protein